MQVQEHQIGEMPLVLGKKSYTLFFDYTFVSILQGLTNGQSFEDIVKKEPMRLIPLITLAAIKAGDDVNDLTDLPTERQISRLLLTAGAETNKAILDNYNMSMGFIGAVYVQTVNAVSDVEKAGNTK